MQFNQILSRISKVLIRVHSSGYCRAVENSHAPEMRDSWIVKSWPTNCVIPQVWLNLLWKRKTGKNHRMLVAGRGWKRKYYFYLHSIFPWLCFHFEFGFERETFSICFWESPWCHEKVNSFGEVKTQWHLEISKWIMI